MPKLNTAGLGFSELKQDESDKNKIEEETKKVENVKS